MHEQMMERRGDVHAGVINNFLSDHRPITLQWRREYFRHGMPFKFNQAWLDDQDFNTLVHFIWNHECDHEPSPMVHILDKLEFARRLDHDKYIIDKETMRNFDVVSHVQS